MSQSLKTLHEFGTVSSKASSIKSVSGSGALGNLAVGSNLVLVRTTGAATATLGASAIGTVKTVVLVTDGGDLVVTPSTLVGGTTITFADAGDSVTCVFTSAGWIVTANNGAAIA